MAGVGRSGGKVILLGEHAVVYGSPALAVGIQRGVTATARAAETPSIQIGEHQARSGDPSPLGQALRALVSALGVGPHRVEVSLDLPPGRGLGASAAIAVAVARSLLSAAGEEPADERVLVAADAWERVFHGTPSGVDAAAAANGGCLIFRRGEGPTPILVARPLILVIGVAGPPAGTREMVEQVRALRERRPDVVQKSVEGIAALVKNASLCVTSGDLPGLGRLMDLNQMLLAGLFVSTDGIEQACQLAREAGALGAKLTGAGGGGSVVALADQDPAPVLAAWEAAGLLCFSAEVPASAVKPEL